MTRKLLFTVLLCMPLILQADQRVWFAENGDYYDPANPWHRKASYLELPLPKVDGFYQVKLFYADGQVALEGLSPTPDFNRKDLLGDVVEYYADGQVSVQASYVVRDQICDCGNNYPVLHGAYKAYHPNGQLERSLDYYGGGIADGDYTEYDEAGRVTRRYSIRNYRRHGDYAEYKNGQLTKEAYYVNGAREGNYRELDEQGHLIRKATFLDGKYQGVLETYRDGILASEEHYHEGNRLGLQKTYYPDGTPKRVYIASKFRSQPVGEDLYYRMDGSLSRKVMRVLDDNGRLVESRDEQYGDGERLVKLKHKVGDWQLEEEYSESGELIARREQDDKGLQGLLLTRQWSTLVREHYKDGEKHGDSLREGSGGAREEGRYENGLKTGPWLTLQSNGITEKVNYRAGKRHGRYERLDETGERSDVIHYENGQKHGPADFSDGYGHRVVANFYKDEPDGDYLETTDNGRIVRQGNYRRGKPEGVHYEFSSVGQMLKKRSYRDGEPHGEWIEMGYGGMSVIRKHYENGTLISEGDIALDSLSTSRVR